MGSSKKTIWATNRKIPSSKFKLADMALGLRAADLLVKDAVEKAERSIMKDEDAAMVKLFCSEMVNKVADDSTNLWRDGTNGRNAHSAVMER